MFGKRWSSLHHGSHQLYSGQYSKVTPSRFLTDCQNPSFHQIKVFFFVKINNTMHRVTNSKILLLPAGKHCWPIVSDGESTVSERIFLLHSCLGYHFATKTKKKKWKNSRVRGTFFFLLLLKNLTFWFVDFVLQHINTCIVFNAEI